MLALGSTWTFGYIVGIQESSMRAGGGTDCVADGCISRARNSTRHLESAHYIVVECVTTYRTKRSR